MLVRVIRDSGPYAVYVRANAPGSSVFDVPDDVFLRFEEAEREYLAATDALERAMGGET